VKAKQKSRRLNAVCVRTHYDQQLVAQVDLSTFEGQLTAQSATLTCSHTNTPMYEHTVLCARARLHWMPSWGRAEQMLAPVLVPVLVVVLVLVLVLMLALLVLVLVLQRQLSARARRLEGQSSSRLAFKSCLRSATPSKPHETQRCHLAWSRRRVAAVVVVVATGVNHRSATLHWITAQALLPTSRGPRHRYTGQRDFHRVGTAGWDRQWHRSKTTSGT
jgi:hypothetical protein